LQPPVAPRRPHPLEIHGQTRVDDYFWLNDREDPEVIAYIEAENAYCEEQLAPTRPLQEKLFAEIKERIPQTDRSVPVRVRSHWYHTRTEDGLAYPIHCRSTAEDGPEQVLLDVNLLAEGQSFCEVAGRAVRRSEDLLAYAVDYVGRRLYTIRFRDLGTGEELDVSIEGTSGDMVWAEDDKTLFYTRKDPQTLRPDRVFRHVLGTDPAEDVCVFHEPDETYYVGLGKSTSRRYLFIGCEHTLRSEVRYLDAEHPEGEWRVFLPREGEHEYDLDHHAGSWWIRTNEGARNFRLCRCADSTTSREDWVEVLAHRDDALLTGVEIFDSHLVSSERVEGLRQLRVLDHDGREQRSLAFEEPAYEAHLGANPESDAREVRVHYSSMTTPESVLAFDLVSGERRTLKQQEVGGHFDRTEYVTDRLWATGRDGTRIPISMVRRADTPVDGSAPCVIYGYGSYGISLDASFSASRLSLLDRGFVFTIAHIRGGSELGRHWYDAGKTVHKWNTFHDFIDCAEHLVAQRLTSPDRLFCWGGSAGGLLVGCVVNERPDLFHGAISQVPFVDIVTTMLDDSIPLTTGEYDEWGDPHQREAYDRMLSYSPYDNVRAQRYPHLLVMTGLHDSQVQYWEPAKWVAKLRQTKTGDERVLFKTNMDAGHGGASGRYERYREVSLQYAFLLDRVGIRD
jgi:oligopeptidase B